MSAPAIPKQTKGDAEVTPPNKEKLHSGSSSEDYTPSASRQNLQQENEVLELARKFTSQSMQYDHGSPFEAIKDGPLDPKSDHFRARDWAKSFYELRYSSGDAIPRTAGFAFQGVNVSGTGSPTDFQSTVGNIILKLPALFGKGSQKIEILRDMDCLLLPGEQLCVLGPPG